MTCLTGNPVRADCRRAVRGGHANITERPESPEIPAAGRQIPAELCFTQMDVFDSPADLAIERARSTPLAQECARSAAL